MNGTLRDDENQACQNCGQIGHRKYDCPEKQNFTANIICRVCGNAGHMARDCPDRQKGASWRNDGPPRAAGRIGSGDAVDREYEVSFPFPLYKTLETRISSNSFLSNSCKNSEVAPADPLLVSKLVLALSITVAAAMRSLGNEALQVLQPRGAHATTNRTAKAALLLLGATVIVAMTTARAAITTEVKVKAKAKAKTTMVVLRRPARHLGIKLLPDSRSTPAIPAIQATAQLPAWDHLPVLHRLEVL